MDEHERLRTAVQDERARRSWAEKELAKEAARSQTWRGRAEDRTARIHLLEERLADAKNRPPVGVFRAMARAGRNLFQKKAATAAPTETKQPRDVETAGADKEAATATGSRRHYPSYPTIRVAALCKQRLPFLDQFDTTDLGSDLDALYQADFIIATVSELAGSSRDVVNALAEWTDAPGRQPLVIWSDQPVPDSVATIVGCADLVLGDAEGGSVSTVVTFSPGIELEDLLVAPGPNGDQIDPLAVVARRRSYRYDSPQARAAELLSLLGVDAASRTPEVGVLLVTNKPGYVIGAVESVLAQENVTVFVAVVLHGDREMFSGVRERLDQMLGSRPSIVIELDSTSTLGEGLNRAAAACSSPLLAKFDDDDWYGPHYLEDALIALDVSQADVVGKARYFVEIEYEGDVYLVDGPEESFSDHVIGSSLVFRRSLWEKVPFPHRPSRVDSVFLRGVRAIGAKIYSNSRFEHGVRRRASGHTWQVDAAHFSARGARVGDSFDDVRVDAEEVSS